MRLLLKLVLGAAIFATSTEAFSPPSRSRVLNDLKEMRMTGAGGAAQPDNYVEGESMPIRGRMDNRRIVLQYTATVISFCTETIVYDCNSLYILSTFSTQYHTFTLCIKITHKIIHNYITNQQ